MIFHQNYPKPVPSGHIASNGAYRSVGNTTLSLSCWGWGAFLLPYLDLATLYQKTISSGRLLNEEHQSGGLVMVSLPVYRCLSDSAPSIRPNRVGLPSNVSFQAAVTSNHAGNIVIPTQAQMSQTPCLKKEQLGYSGAITRFVSGISQMAQVI